MITWPVWSRVVRFVGEEGRAGTAFLTGSGADQRLITARHLCISEPEEVITLCHPWTNDGEPFQDNATRIGLDVSPTADFAVFRLTFPIAEIGDDVPLTSDEFGYSQAAYILGYPYGLSLRPRYGTQQLPLVKGCTISGTETSAGGVHIIYIDAIVNPGFSGGPLVFLHPTTGQPCFAGVVASAMFAPMHEPTPEQPHPPRVPAGIGVVTSELTFRTALSD